jgi:hypothetical protein
MQPRKHVPLTVLTSKAAAVPCQSGTTHSMKQTATILRQQHTPSLLQTSPADDAYAPKRPEKQHTLLCACCRHSTSIAATENKSQQHPLGLACTVRPIANANHRMQPASQPQVMVVLNVFCLWFLWARHTTNREYKSTIMSAATTTRHTELHDAVHARDWKSTRCYPSAHASAPPALECKITSLADMYVIGHLCPLHPCKHHAGSAAAPTRLLFGEQSASKTP